MMARQPRHIVFGTVYHLIARFVDQTWFIASEEARAMYLRLLGKALSRSDWTCLAYAIMSNHIHLALVAGRQSLASWIRRAHSPFAGWLNDTRGRIGPILVRGPKTLDVETARVGNVIAYIHNNPVRAGVVDTASASRWTSHRAYVGLDSPPAWLRVDDGLRRAGFTDPHAFDTWVGDPETDRLERERARAVAARPRPRIVAPTLSTIDPGVIVQATADTLGLSVDRLQSRRRGRSEHLARRIAVLSAAEVGISGAAIARALHVSQQTVSLIATRTESEKVRDLASRVVARATSVAEAPPAQLVQLVA